MAVGAALRVKPAGEDAVDCRRLGLGDLVSHLLETHHVYTRRELGRLPRLLDKVCGVHGERHPELLEIRQLFESLKMDLEPHMRKEEQLLFPYVRALEQARHRGQSAPPSCFGTVRNPIGMMRTEHESAGQVLEAMRKAARDYEGPKDACVSYRALYDALETFERDLHQHIHLENNILFPAVVELEDCEKKDGHNRPPFFVV